MQAGDSRTHTRIIIYCLWKLRSQQLYIHAMQIRDYNSIQINSSINKMSQSHMDYTLFRHTQNQGNKSSLSLEKVNQFAFAAVAISTSITRNETALSVFAFSNR